MNNDPVFVKIEMNLRFMRDLESVAWLRENVDTELDLEGKFGAIADYIEAEADLSQYEIYKYMTGRIYDNQPEGKLAFLPKRCDEFSRLLMKKTCYGVKVRMGKWRNKPDRVIMSWVVESSSLTEIEDYIYDSDPMEEFYKNAPGTEVVVPSRKYPDFCLGKLEYSAEVTRVTDRTGAKEWYDMEDEMPIEEDEPFAGEVAEETPKKKPFRVSSLVPRGIRKIFK